MRRGVFGVEDFGIDPFDLDLHAVGHAAMGQRFGNGFIGVFNWSVFADDGHFHFAFGVVDAVADVFPFGQIGFGGGADLERVQHRLIQTFAVIGQRGVVNGAQVLRRNHRLRADVAEQRQFFTFLLAGSDPRSGRPECQAPDRWSATLSPSAVSAWFSTRRDGLDVGQQRQVHETGTDHAAILAELTDRLEKGQALDIADGAADFAEHEINLILANGDEILDLVGDMRDHLNGFAKVVAATFFFQNVGINPARADRVGLARRLRR